MQFQDGCFFSNFVSILFCNSIRIAHNLEKLPQRKLEGCFDIIASREDKKWSKRFTYNISINKIIMDLNKYLKIDNKLDKYIPRLFSITSL